MRSLLLTAIMASSLSAFAAESKTVLHVPLFVEITGGVQPNPTYTYVPVSEINKKLVAKGQKAQLESVDISADSPFDSFKAIDDLNAALEAAGIKNAQAAGELVPATYSTGSIRTCYRGNGDEVVGIVLQNVDNLYSDQFTLIGWKHGAKTVFGDSIDSTDKEQLEGLAEASKLWKYYSKKSDAVVMLASVGDDGDDVQESYIPRCK